MLVLIKMEQLTDEVLKNNLQIEFNGKIYRKGYDGNDPEAFRTMLRRTKNENT